MDGIDIAVTGGGALVSYFDAAAAQAPAKVKAFIGMWGLMLETEIKARADVASHDPGTPRVHPWAPGNDLGPERITGDYLRSIHADPVEASGVDAYLVDVGTIAPQGARLEFGFQGTDARGRNFRQAHPYPHFQPAIESLTPAFEAAAAEVLP